MVGTPGRRKRGVLRSKGGLKVRRRRKGEQRKTPVQKNPGINQYSTTMTKPPKASQRRSRTSEGLMVSAYDVAGRIISGNGVARTLIVVHPSPPYPESVPAMTMVTTIWSQRNPSLRESERGIELRSWLLQRLWSTPVGKHLCENGDRNLRWISIRIFRRGL
jgi:hypothetical protein